MYFTCYVVLVQQLFNQQLKRCYKQTLEISEIKLLTNKFSKIQTFIAEISDILSPLLLIICGISTYEVISNAFYFFQTIIEFNLYTINVSQSFFHNYKFHKLILTGIGFGGNAMRIYLIYYYVMRVNYEVSENTKLNNKC